MLIKLLGYNSPKSFLRSYNLPHLDNIRHRMILATLRTPPRIKIQLEDNKKTIEIKSRRKYQFYIVKRFTTQQETRR